MSLNARESTKVGLFAVTIDGKYVSSLSCYNRLRLLLEVLKSIGYKQGGPVIYSYTDKVT